MKSTETSYHELFGGFSKEEGVTSEQITELKIF